MLKLISKRIKNEKGLSLVELLAVIVILAIIAAIAIPAIGNIIANSEAKAEVADAIQVMNAANIYFADNPNATEFNQDNAGDYLEGIDNFATFSVNNENPRKITFNGERVDSPEGGATLDQLSNAEVSGGEVTGWGQ